MFKKLLSLTLTCSMLLSAAGVTLTTASAASALPAVVSKTVNTSGQTVLADEDFEVHSAEADYSTVYKAEGVTAPFGAITKNSGTITVKQETDGNKYILFSGSTDAWHQRLNVSSINTSNSVLVSYDYRNATGQIRLDVSGTYGTGDAKVTNNNAIVSCMYTNGTYIKNQNPDTTMSTIGTTITLTEGEWTNFKAYIVPASGTIQFYINDEYRGCANYRKNLDYITYLWIGVENGKSAEIDNVSVVNMGSSDDTYYHFKELERLTFDYDSETNSDGTDISPLFINNSSGSSYDATKSAAVINTDGTFKMTSSTATNGVSKHYQHTFAASPSGDYAKLSFRYKIETTTTAPRIDMYMNSTNIGSVMMYPNKVTSTYQTGSGSSGNVVTNLAATSTGWHTMDVFFNFKDKILVYVIDGTLYQTVSSQDIQFRNANTTALPNIYFRFMTTDASDVGYIDDVVLYEDATEYTAPELSSPVVSIDSTGYTISMSEKVASAYADMDDIADDITSDKACTISVSDSDASGDFSDGDTVKVTLTSTGVTYTYTVDVITNLDTSTEALIVKGGDGQGDDFSWVQTITKAGAAEIELRIKNNMSDSITPAVVAAAYDDSGKMISLDVADSTTIASGDSADVELVAEIPSNLSAGRLKLFVWESLASQAPLIKPVEYTIDTNDFKVPTVISNNMVLQRNSTAYIFGNAPEGATVTAALADEAEGSYTVPAGSNEFFVGLELGDYNATGQTLTVSAVDRNGVDMGTVTRTGVLIGDVYYGGGQSNMTRTFAGTAADIGNGLCDNYEALEKEQFTEDYEALGDSLVNVRFFASLASDNYNSRYAYTDEELASKEVWKTLDSSNIGSSYEVMVRMAGDIQSYSGTDVPIGIICVAQGGTKIAKWVSRDTLVGNFDQSDINDYETNVTNASNPSRWATHTDLYYAGVRSVMPYGIKAAVWYQGESDSSSNYDKYMKAMIDEFRAGMRKDMPYFVVQLPGYVSGTWTEGTNPTGDAWAKRRLIQWNVQEQMTDVYAVVTNDSGDNGNIHPANKEVVGDRLARYILAKAHNEDIAFTGPTFNSVTYTEGAAAVKLNLYGGELKMYDPTEGTNIFCLYDGSSWHLADSIAASGDTVTVSSSEITGMVSGVRYAYGPEIIKCIYTEYEDGAMLPLAPFDTSFVFNTLD